MERKGGRIFLVNISLLTVQDEFELAREYGYRIVTSLPIMESQAILIKAKLERILKRDFDHSR